MHEIDFKQLTNTLRSLNPAETLELIDFLQQQIHRQTANLEASISCSETQPAVFSSANNQLQKEINERLQVEAALEQSERKFRAIFDGTYQFIGLLTTDGIITEANRTALEAVGIERSEVIGLPFWESPWWAHSLELQEKLRQGIKEASTGKLVRFESEHILADGQLHYIDFSLNPILDANGKVIMLIPEGRDITDRRKAELELRETLRSLEFQKLALDQAAIVAITDRRGIITYVNDQFCQISQYSREEIIGKTHRLINSGYHPPEFFQQLWSTITQGKIWKGEIKNRAKDGSYYWVATTIVPFLDDQQEPFQYLAIRFDVSERKQGEQKIREQAALLDIATDAILVCDLENKIQFWNHGAEQIYGWSAAEVIGQNAELLNHPSNEKAKADLQEALRIVLLKDTWQGELSNVTKNGNTIIVASRWALVRDERGNPKAILSVDTDVTEKKSLEQQFFRAQRLENLGTLASGIAHDLNNIFTPIIAASQLLPRTVDNINERSQRLLELLESSAKRGSDLIKQILSFARGLDGEKNILQVGHLLVEIVSIARQTFPRNIQIEMDVSTRQLWTVRADATQLQQIFMNLVVNARDAMPNGGTLSISAENIYVDQNFTQTNIDAQEGFYTVVTVTDTGIGMSPEVLDCIFDPFFSTKPKDQGTGLGLSTVFGIVKSHGGFLDVTSEPNCGSCFKVFIPALKESQLSESSESQEELTTTLMGHGETVLIVDDEASVREITKISLEAFNYCAVTAADGIEALAVYAQQQHEIQFVLMDVMMPFLDSKTVIQTLKRINPGVQIVVMSGLETNEHFLIDEGVQGFLEKPFNAQALLKILSDLKAQHAPQNYSVADL